ncbi:MAG TPA: aminoglycoside phosphotransferase family protein [Nocardioidaceae bacterium]|nr:aminoglycoside phosphotransferase family protein [Nocardioidaceae bacterium]
MSSREAGGVRQGSPLIPFEIPPDLAAPRPGEPGWLAWIEALPRLVRDVVDEWELTYDGEPMHGYCALVVPVLMADGRSAVAKFSWPHDEEEHEYLLMQALHGNGAALLYRADPARQVMLLERLHSRDLRSVADDVEACEITASFYERIHIAAMPQLRTLTTYIARWTDDLRRLPRDAPIPRRLVEQAISLGDDFVADPASVGVAIHGDLHFENVLAADREPWLVIDPKPMSGDPHYEVSPLLWNRWDEIVESGDVRRAVRRRFHAVVDVAGLDEGRARDWVVIREVHNAMWTLHDADGDLSDGDREWITAAVAIAKAVRD